MEAFRHLSEDEIAPIHLEIENKGVVVNISLQTLSCIEEKIEENFALVPTGTRFDKYGNRIEKWETPLGV